jgi:hypothetical protein
MALSMIPRAARTPCTGKVSYPPMTLMNSETKTASPGRPIAAKAPSARSPPAHGIRAASPPRSEIRRVPVREAIIPTRIKSSAE